MSSKGPPFGGSGDNDRTILKPTPGGRRPAGGPAPGGPSAPPPPPPPAGPGAPGRPPIAPGSAAPPPPPSMQGGAAPGAPVSLDVDAPGINRLVDSAAALLALAGQLRGTVAHPDPRGLAQHVGEEIARFEQKARAAGASPEAVLAARYGLCTVLDEFVLSTPWGSGSDWGTHTLLSRFHNEGWGGEKFFAILERLSQDPTGNIELIELFYLCLALGFEGKYKVQERGGARLQEIQDNLLHMVRAQRGEHERELSPHWLGVQDLRNPLARYVPLWVVAAGGAAVLLVAFLLFSLVLSSASNPTYVELQTLGRNLEPVQIRSEPTRTANLATFLAPEIREGLVEVEDRPGRSTVLVKGAGLFGSGSALLDERRLPLMARIAAALNEVDGRILVTGHTDSDPIPGSLRLKFPSNYELSQERANAVMEVLETQGVFSQRLQAEGRADSEPLVPNDSRANKARNRRVEIILAVRS